MNPGLLALALLAVGAVLSSLHASLVDVVRTTLEEIASESSSAARKRRVAAILDDIAGHARAVALVRTPFNLGATIALVFWVAWLRGVGAPEWLDALVGGALAALALWVLGVFIPEAVSLHAGARLVFALSGVVRAHAVGAPLRPIAAAFDRAVRGLSGNRPDDAAADVEAEVLSALDEGEREGGVDERERDMIEAVMHFKDRTVEQIMTPRNEVEAIELASNLGQIAAFVRKARHSRIPVFRGSLDDISGFLRQGPAAVAGGRWRAVRGFELRTIVRPAMVVPVKTVRELLEEFIARRVTSRSSPMSTAAPRES